MKKFLTCFTIFVALTLALGLGVSNAGNLTAANIKVANTSFGGASPNTIQLSFAGSTGNVTYQFGVDRSDTSINVLTVTLNNAQFAGPVAASSLTMTRNGGSIVGNVVSVQIRSNATAGSNSVVFEIDGISSGGGIKTGDVFGFTLPKLQGLASLATVGTQVTISSTIQDVIGQFDAGGTHTNIPVVTSAAPMTATFTANTNATSASNAPNSPIIDVAQGGKFFGDSTKGAAANQTLVNLGSLTLANAPGVVDVNGSAVGMTPQDTATITLTPSTGTFAAAVGTAGNMGFYLSTDPAGASNVIANAAPTATLASLSAAGTAFPNGLPVYIFMKVNGTTPIDPTTPIATLNYVRPAPQLPTTAGPTNLLTLTKNGTTRRVFNVPAANNAQDNGFVRITNTSSITGNIRGTLIFEDGTSTSQFVLVPNMAPGATDSLSSADIQNAAGLANPWTGRARLTIEGEIPSMEVMATIRNKTTGTLVEMDSMAIQ